MMRLSGQSPRELGQHYEDGLRWKVTSRPIFIKDSSGYLIGLARSMLSRT